MIGIPDVVTKIGAHKCRWGTDRADANVWQVRALDRPRGKAAAGLPNCINRDADQRLRSTNAAVEVCLA